MGMGQKGVPCTMGLYSFHDKILIHFGNLVSTRYFHIIVRALNRTLNPFYLYVTEKIQLLAFVYTTKSKYKHISFTNLYRVLFTNTYRMKIF